MRLFRLGTLVVGALLLCQAAAWQEGSGLHEKPVEQKLPNGKLQSEEILKADYAKSLRDAEQLVSIAQALQSDMEKETSHVLAIGDLKKLDEIEKITKRLRGRIRRF